MSVQFRRQHYSKLSGLAVNDNRQFVALIARTIGANDPPVIFAELKRVSGLARREARPALADARAQAKCRCNAFDVP